MKRTACLLIFASMWVTTSGASAISEPHVKVNKCLIGYEKPQFDGVIGYGVDFTNTSHHIMTSVRFNFTYTTASGEILGGALQTDEGSFAPGVEIDHTMAPSVLKQFFASSNNAGPSVFHWQSRNPSSESIANMKLSCTVDEVTFQDGTAWNADQQTSR